MTRRGWLCAGALFIGSIGCSPPIVDRSSHAIPAPGDGHELIVEIGARAERSGATRMKVAATGIGAESDRLGVFIEAQPETCVLLVAVASSGVADLDLFAFGDDGATVGADEGPSQESAILVCPPRPGRLYASARIVTGAGRVTIGVADVPEARAIEVGKAVNARNLAESGRLDIWPGLEAKIADRRSRMGSRWQDARRLILPLDPRAATRTSIELEADRCIDVFATPSEEVASLDLAAEDEDGVVVARGEPSGRDRSMLLCTGSGTLVTIVLRPRETPGTAALVIGASPPFAEAELERSTRVDRVTASEALPAAQKTLAAKLSAYGAARVAGRGDAKVGSRSELDVELRDGCARVDVVAGEPLGPISAALWDDAGALLAEARGTLGAALFTCGPKRTGRLDVEATTIPGPFAVEVRELPKVPPAWSAHPLASSRLLGRLSAVESGALPDLDAVRVVHMTAAARADQAIKVAPHTCIELGAAIDSGGSGLELRWVDEADHSDTIRRGRHVVADRACASADAREFRAELRLTTGEGDVLVVTRETP